jgi:hypothetical protein
MYETAGKRAYTRALFVRRMIPVSLDGDVPSLPSRASSSTQAAR